MTQNKKETLKKKEKEGNREAFFSWEEDWKCFCSVSSALFLLLC